MCGDPDADAPPHGKPPSKGEGRGAVSNLHGRMKSEREAIDDGWSGSYEQVRNTYGGDSRHPEEESPRSRGKSCPESLSDVPFSVSLNPYAAGMVHLVFARHRKAISAVNGAGCESKIFAKTTHQNCCGASWRKPPRAGKTIALA